MEVLKRSGSREKYSHAKLLRSLLFANDHLPDADAAFALADTIEKNLLAKLTDQVNHVSAADIAQTVLGVLKRFDTRAYVKYLSYQTDTLDAKDLRQYLKGSRV
jgi:transcriptional regulator NrdR family protein